MTLQEDNDNQGQEGNKDTEGYDHIEGEGPEDATNDEGYQQGTLRRGELALQWTQSVGDKDQQMEWLKHGKGIGHKILHAQGYQPGKGLGVELQGRPSPVTHETMGVNITVNRKGEAVKDTSVRAGLGFKPGEGGGTHPVKSVTNQKEIKYKGNFVPESQVSVMEILESKPQWVRTSVRPHAAEHEAEAEIMNIYDSEDNHKTGGWVYCSYEAESPDLNKEGDSQSS